MHYYAQSQLFASEIKRRPEVERLLAAGDNPTEVPEEGRKLTSGRGELQPRFRAAEYSRILGRLAMPALSSTIPAMLADLPATLMHGTY